MHSRKCNGKLYYLVCSIANTVPILKTVVIKTSTTFQTAFLHVKITYLSLHLFLLVKYGNTDAK